MVLAYGVQIEEPMVIGNLISIKQRTRTNHQSMTALRVNYVKITLHAKRLVASMMKHGDVQCVGKGAEQQVEINVSKYRAIEWAQNGYCD